MKVVARVLLAGAALALAFGAPTTAWAQYVGTGPTVVTTPSEVSGEQTARSTATATAEGGTASRRSGLPVTGSDLAGLTVIGLGALAAGMLLVRRRGHWRVSPGSPAERG